MGEIEDTVSPERRYTFSRQSPARRDPACFACSCLSADHQYITTRRRLPNPTTAVPAAVPVPVPAAAAAIAATARNLSEYVYAGGH